MNTITQREIIQQTYPFLQEQDIGAILDIAEYKPFKHRSVIIKSTEINTNIYFILEGMIRGYFINDKGVEKNIFLRPEHTFSGSPNSLFDKKESKYTFEAITDSKFLCFDQLEFQELMGRNPRVLKLYMSGLQENIKTMVLRIESLIDKMPEQRYDELLNNHPQFFQKAYHKHIANYLGITSVSLSRIIKRKLQKKD